MIQQYLELGLHYLPYANFLLLLKLVLNSNWLLKNYYLPTYKHQDLYSKMRAKECDEKSFKNLVELIKKG